jgi:hypothetical protein
MSTSVNHQAVQKEPGRVAVAGRDDWLRRAIVSRLVSTGLAVRNFGAGSTSLDRCDTLVLTPRLVPCTGNAIHDIGLSASTLTLVGAIAGDIDQVVLVSLVGADPKQTGHLGALGVLHSKIVGHGWNPTVIRATQIYGATNDPGPLVQQMDRTLQRDGGRLRKQRIDPVRVADVLDVVEDAVCRRLAPGIVEIVGSHSLEVGEFIEEVGRQIDYLPSSLSTAHRFRRWWGRHYVDHAMSELLESQSSGLQRNVVPPPKDDIGTNDARSESDSIAEVA